jgi:Cof subfamily protein (haloacid dehalogenase superfamily)
MPTPQILVLDLDGTTLTAERRIAEVDLAAARRLIAAGVHVTIATGRLFTGTRWVAQALGVTGSVAVMNGSELVDVQGQHAVHGRYLDREVRPAIRRVLREHGVSSFLFESRRIHYAHRDERLMPYLGIWTEDLCAHPDVLEHAPWDDVDEIVAVCAAGHVEAIAAVKVALDALGPDVQSVVFSTFEGEAFLKLRHAAEDKGTALARLAEERGATVAQCVAVGDWYNDVPMLRIAGRSFAMAHARDDVKASAQEVLEASREGGAIAEVARRVWDL